MKRLHLVCIGLVLVLLAAGCGRQRSLSPELAGVESVLFSNPDSALSMLSSIDSTSLRSDNDKAAFYLFRTIAKDKCFLDVSNDTMIAFSADHYNKTNQPYYEMLANCYYSRVKFENREFARSVVLAMKARERAAQIHNPFYEGLASRNIRDAYLENYHYSDCLKYSYEAYNKFCEAGIQPYINYAMFDIATSLISVGEARKSFSWLFQTMDSAKIYGDPYLIADCNRELAKAYLTIKEYDKASALYQDLIKAGNALRVDSIYLAKIYVREGKLDLAKDLIFTSDSYVNLRESWVRWQYYEKKGNTDSLVVQLRRCLDNTLDIADLQTENEIPSVMSDYFLLEQQINHEKDKAARFRSVIIIVSLVILLICGGLVSLLIVRRHKRKIDENVALALQMQEDLFRLTKNHEEYNSKVKNLLSTKYLLLDQLSQIVYISPTSTAAKRRISETITGLIAELSREDSPKNKELAAFVDEAFNNLYTRFRDDFPNLRQGEYNLFVYSVLGFSASTISVFLGEKSVTTIYERKRRLRNKIKATSTPRQDEYLAFMGQRATT